MRSIRSFAKARSRLSANHKKILKQENDFLFSANTKSAFEETLRNTNNKILEIGFGEGDSLFEMAINNPELNFFGIEVYENGVARTCSKIEDSRFPSCSCSAPSLAATLKSQFLPPAPTVVTSLFSLCQ